MSIQNRKGDILLQKMFDACWKDRESILQKVGEINDDEHMVKELKRLRVLEEKAKDIFIQNSDWAGIINMLDEKEEKEYWILFSKIYNR